MTSDKSIDTIQGRHDTIYGYETETIPKREEKRPDYGANMKQKRSPKREEKRPDYGAEMKQKRSSKREQDQPD